MVSPAGTSTIGYADNGWVTSRVLPNGSTTDYTYNAVGMMTSLTNKKSNGSALTSFGTTSYDGAFNLTGMTATYSFPTSYGGASTWTYDDKDQLTNETSARNGGWNHTNEYDDAGNPTKFKNNTRTYNSNNQLTTGSMSYDGNGNPTTYAGATLTYDEQNRVTSIGSLLTCGYRADGQRAWKQGSTGGKTYFLYDQGNPIVEMNLSGTVTATNVYAPDGLVARKEGSNAWAYYLFDMQGNVTQKLSPSEAVTSGRVVDAWGTGQSTLTPYSPDCFGYNAKWGYYYDTQTGLYLCQHRMYDASTGRWLNRDPIGYDGGVNLYGYCGSGAVGRVDSSGLIKIIPDSDLIPIDGNPPNMGFAKGSNPQIITMPKGSLIFGRGTPNEYATPFLSEVDNCGQPPWRQEMDVTAHRLIRDTDFLIGEAGDATQYYGGKGGHGGGTQIWTGGSRLVPGVDIEPCEVPCEVVPVEPIEPIEGLPTGEGPSFGPGQGGLGGGWLLLGALNDLLKILHGEPLTPQGPPIIAAASPP